MRNTHGQERVTYSMNAHGVQSLGVKGTKRILMGLVVAAAMTVPHWALSAAGPVAVDLGSTAHFAILAGAGITSTGGGIIYGDVGASPIAGSAIGLNAAQVNGIIYATDASGPAGSVVDPVMLTAAKGDLTIAFNAARDRTPVPTGPFLNPNGGNIGTLNLGPGLYKFTTTALITGADVTLTGGRNDVWIFQCAQDLQVGSGIKVVLAGGARAQNIFWQVGTSAVLGTSSVFRGTILADQSVTMGTSSSMVGRALAFTAGVTFNGSSGVLPTTNTNTAPVAVADVYATAQNTTLTLVAPGVLANDVDAGGNPLTAILVTGPTSGTLTFNADGSFVYVPAAGFQGGDRFTYKANNGTTDSNITTVSLTVHAGNNAPVALADAYVTPENTTLTVTPPGVLTNDTDADGDSLTAIKVTDPANGTLTLNANGSFVYVPAAGFSGGDSFTYKANDGVADSNVVAVTLTVVPSAVTALQVFIDPSAAIAAGAMWRIQGETTYNPSGFVETGLTPGPAVVEFNPVAGWVAPNNQNVAILTGQTVVTTGSYATIPVGNTANYKITYKGCALVADSSKRILTVTNANAAIVKIQKLKSLPKNHNDVAGKVLYLLDSPGIDFLNATGTITTLTGIGAFIGTINADVTDSIKMGVVDTAVAAPATSISATSATHPVVATLKVSLTGVSLSGLATNTSSAAAVAIRISAKKLKGATVPAGVAAGAQILAGNGLSLDVIGGNILADRIESQGGIKSLTVKNLGQLVGGNIGQAPATSATLTTTLETLGDFLTPAAVAAIQHPSTPIVVSGLHSGPSLATDGFGKIIASTVHGVFVAGADLVGDLVEPRCDAAVKSWKATNSSGDAFVNAPTLTQPAGIVAHTTAP